MPGPPRVSPKELVSCRNCQRNFYKDRIAKHESICKKTLNKKRKVFDSAKQRVQGTDAEDYYKKAQKSKKKVLVRKNNWRKKHEEFITAIRNAKKVQQHLQMGGNLKDLPPPPPATEDPDFIRCPSCNRTFNETAAARHIPRCASYEFNKPKVKSKAIAHSSKKRF